MTAQLVRLLLAVLVLALGLLAAGWARRRSLRVRSPWGRLGFAACSVSTCVLLSAAALWISGV